MLIRRDFVEDAQEQDAEDAFRGLLTSTGLDLDAVSVGGGGGRGRAASRAVEAVTATAGAPPTRTGLHLDAVAVGEAADAEGCAAASRAAEAVTTTAGAPPTRTGLHLDAVAVGGGGGCAGRCAAASRTAEAVTAMAGAPSTRTMLDLDGDPGTEDCRGNGHGLSSPPWVLGGSATGGENEARPGEDLAGRRPAGLYARVRPARGEKDDAGGHASGTVPAMDAWRLHPPLLHWRRSWNSCRRLIITTARRSRRLAAAAPDHPCAGASSQAHMRWHRQQQGRTALPFFLPARLCLFLSSSIIFC